MILFFHKKTLPFKKQQIIINSYFNLEISKSNRRIKGNISPSITLSINL